MKNPPLDQIEGPREEEKEKSQSQQVLQRKRHPRPLTTQDLEEPSHQEFKTGVADDQPIAEASQHPEWFQIQTKPPTPDRAWNKTLPATHRSIQPWISDLIIAVTKLQIVEWNDYKHLDWITMLKDDDKLYKFKEGDFKRLRIQDIEDMLLLLVQGKLTILTVKERFAFNVSLRIFTRSIVIQWHVEDLQLGVKLQKEA
nr:hypothetical protein [Tanacetum cinerariifolium]